MGRNGLHKWVFIMSDFKEKQQDLTELNGDGNRDRGRYGEDLKEEMPSVLKILKENTIAKLVKGEVIVTFNKINGDKRVMTCTLQEGVVPEATKTDTISQKKVQKINEDNIIILDTREKSDFKKGHISNAASYELSSSKELENTEVVVYDKDETASISSAEKLAKNNDLNVIYLEGGIQSWIENNLPLVEKS